MNARFPYQFRTAIEVREIGNPSENDVVRLLYIRDISQALFAFLFSCVLSLRAWEKTEKTERMQERGEERKRLGCRDNTTEFPSWPAFSILRIIHFFLPDATRHCHPHPVALPIPADSFVIGIVFFPVTAFEDTLPPVFGVLIDLAFRERDTSAFVRADGGQIVG